MSTSIVNAFTKTFQSEVHLAYQRLGGSKLRGTVRSQNNVLGATTVFQKIGKGVAATKARHGLVPLMNLDHSNIECTLTDYYAGDWIDHLDELKTNIAERQVVAQAGAYALGRKTDELILNAANLATTSVGDYSTGLTKELILKTFETLNVADVPDDGQRFGIVGPHQWNELLNIKEFSSSDYAGEEYSWLNGSESRKWLGIVWIMHTGLPVANAERDCFVYHRTAIGHACGQEVKTDITWHGDHSAYFVNNSMSQGACLIDNGGIIKIKCDDNAAIA